jgi:AcrR family transcriptional regulator
MARPAPSVPPASPTGPERGSTRSRLLDGATALFAERGYRATTVGAIEEAAGLSPRAGAFYKHFPSKEAVLRAAVDRWVVESASLPDSMQDLLPLDDLRAELTVVARGTVLLLRRQQELFAFLARDAADFPELMAEVHDRLVRPGYDRLAAYLEARSPRPRPRDEVAAMAALALGALVNAQHHRALYGTPPAGADDEHLVAMWVELWLGWLQSEA